MDDATECQVHVTGCLGMLLTAALVVGFIVVAHDAGYRQARDEWCTADHGEGCLWDGGACKCPVAVLGDDAAGVPQ